MLLDIKIAGSWPLCIAWRRPRSSNSSWTPTTCWRRKDLLLQHLPCIRLPVLRAVRDKICHGRAPITRDTLLHNVSDERSRDEAPAKPSLGKSSTESASTSPTANRSTEPTAAKKFTSKGDLLRLITSYLKDKTNQAPLSCWLCPCQLSVWLRIDQTKGKGFIHL